MLHFRKNVVPILLTPLGVGCAIGMELPSSMHWCLSVRYEVNQFEAVPDIPYQVGIRIIRML